MESSRCSSKTLQKGSCPYAPLDEALLYMYNSPQFFCSSHSIQLNMNNCRLSTVHHDMLISQRINDPITYCRKFSFEDVFVFQCVLSSRSSIYIMHIKIHTHTAQNLSVNIGVGNNTHLRLRARKPLTLFINIPLRTRRVLSP